MKTAMKIAGKPAIVELIRNGRNAVEGDWWYICTVQTEAKKEQVLAAMCEHLGIAKPQSKAEWNSAEKLGWEGIKKASLGYQEIKVTSPGNYRFAAMKPYSL